MTGTYSGQFVMEGFLNLKWSRFARVVLTRSLAIVPTFAIAFYSDISSLTNMNDILNVLQSILLPFAIIPVLHFCSQPSVMGEFALGKFWTIFGPLVAFVIIGMNLFFAYDIIIGFESVAAYAISGVIAVLYFVFCFYMIWLFFREAFLPRLRSLFFKSEEDEELLIDDE
jgi:natural resistance-associated macrophage protein